MLLARKSQDFFPTLFNDLFDFNWNGNYAANAAPQMNIKENNASYEMEFSVPGLTKDDLNISNSSAGSTMPIIICPNCKCRIYISGEIANGLLK